MAPTLSRIPWKNERLWVLREGGMIVNLGRLEGRYVLLYNVADLPSKYVGRKLAIRLE